MFLQRSPGLFRWKRKVPPPPVIALGIGGALDTVVPGKTGIFFDHPETDSLAEAILEFEKFTINSENCRLNAQKFTPAIFRKEFVEKAGLSRMG